MKKTILAMTKLHNNANRVLSLLMIVVGGIFISLPIVFWDFLVYEQFKPTVRPYYPLFYGSLAVAGIIIVLLGILGFVKKMNIKVRRGNFLSNYVIPLFGIIVGVGIFIVSLDLYNTTEYLAADGLFYMILLAPIMGTILLILLVSSGVSIIINSFLKKTISEVSRRASASAIVIVLMAAIIGGVLTLPPDAELKPFPADVPFVTTLYAQGEAGYNTFKIPTMITAPNGTILSFAEARTDHKDDWSKTELLRCTAKTMAKPGRSLYR